MINLPVPEKDFPCWDTLVAATISRFRGRSDIKITQKLESKLFNEAKIWLPNYEACYGDCLKTPWGSYMFTFVVWTVQASKYELPESIEGRKYGQTAIEPKREAPYPDDYRKITWETGYLLGLCERTQNTPC
jgi:hypothetical protein